MKDHSRFEGQRPESVSGASLPADGGCFPRMSARVEHQSTRGGLTVTMPGVAEGERYGLLARSNKEISNSVRTELMRCERFNNFFHADP